MYLFLNPCKFTEDLAHGGAWKCTNECMLLKRAGSWPNWIVLLLFILLFIIIESFATPRHSIACIVCGRAACRDLELTPASPVRPALQNSPQSQANVTSQYNHPQSPCDHSHPHFPEPTFTHPLDKIPSTLTKPLLFLAWTDQIRPLPPGPATNKLLYFNSPVIFHWWWLTTWHSWAWLNRCWFNKVTALTHIMDTYTSLLYTYNLSPYIHLFHDHVLVFMPKLTILWMTSKYGNNKTNLKILTVNWNDYASTEILASFPHFRGDLPVSNGRVGKPSAYPRSLWKKHDC